MRGFWMLMSMLVLATTAARAAQPGRVEYVYTDRAGKVIFEEIHPVLGPPEPVKWAPVTHAPAPPPPQWTPVGHVVRETIKPHPVEIRMSKQPVPAGACGHAADYSWLAGTLEYVHVRQRWTLRFASVDQEDRHGGSVTLTETGSLSRFHSGQPVRVTGSLADPEAREPAPAYRVTSIRALTP